MDLGLDVSERDGVTIVAARGELDMATAPRLRDLTIARLTAGDQAIVLDLSEVEFLDSTGLGTLVAILKRTRSLEARMALVITQPRVMKVFELTALTSAFAIYDSIDAALAEP